MLIEEGHRQRRQLGPIGAVDLTLPHRTVMRRPPLRPTHQLPQQPQRVDQVVVGKRRLLPAVLLQRLAVDAAEVRLPELPAPALPTTAQLVRPLAEAARFLHGVLSSVAAARHEPLITQPAARRRPLEGGDAVASGLIPKQVGSRERPRDGLHGVEIPMPRRDHERSATRVLRDAPRPLIRPIALRCSLLIREASPTEGVADGASSDELVVCHLCAKVHGEHQRVGGRRALERAVRLVDESPHELDRAAGERRVLVAA